MNFNDYTQHLLEDDVPLLGFLQWYNVPGTAQVDYQTFNDLVEQHDAPLRHMPPPKLPDVFRRACNEAKMLKVSGGNDTHMNYTMRDAGHDDDCVYRNLVEEQLDANNHELGYRELAQAIFTRDTGDVTFVWKIDPDDPAASVVKVLEAQVQNFMENRAGLLPAIQVREAIRKALEITLSGLRVRPSGGVYFLSLDKADAIQSLLIVCNALDQCSLHLLPLVDDAKQRHMVKEAFESESVEATTELIGEIMELKSKGNKIPATQFLKIRERYAEQVSKMEQYKGILQSGLDQSQATLELAEGHLRDLLDQTE